MRHWIWMFLPAVLLAACAATSSTATPARTEAPPVPSAVERAPESGIVSTAGVIASARVVPANHSQMSFAISAPIKDVSVREGDDVHAGQVLLTLSVPDLELAVNAAEDEAKSKQLDLAYWIPRLDRPPERREQAQAEADQAKAALATAQAVLTQAQLAAPFDGTVVEVTVRPGEVAQAGQVVLILGDLAHMQIETTDLSERGVSRLQAGQSVQVHVTALDRTLAGHVIRVSPRADTVGGDVVYTVVIELDDQPPGLLWGMTAEVEIEAP